MLEQKDEFLGHDRQTRPVGVCFISFRRSINDPISYLNTIVCEPTMMFNVCIFLGHPWLYKQSTIRFERPTHCYVLNRAGRYIDRLEEIFVPKIYKIYIFFDIWIVIRYNLTKQYFIICLLVKAEFIKYNTVCSYILKSKIYVLNQNNYYNDTK